LQGVSLSTLAIPMKIDLTPEDHQELIRRIERDLIDSYDEELELEIEDRHVDKLVTDEPSEADRSARHRYFRELFRLQGELVKLQDWVAHTRHKVVIL
jgi:polyphosphate kinase 2 (PPK2 family)